MPRAGGVGNQRRVEGEVCGGEVERGREVFCAGHGSVGERVG